MKIAYMASGTFAVPTLVALAAGEHELVRVITQPARPAGRKGKLRPTPIAEACAEMGIEFAEWEDVNSPESIAALAAMSLDAICVADFGQMVRADARATAGRSVFNLHGSVLPALRGAAPVNWAIIRGMASTGVTTFELVDQMDAGPIYLTAEVPITPDMRADDLRESLAAVGADVVCQTLTGLADGSLMGVEQDLAGVTFAPKLKRTDGMIDWTASAESIRNRIHGTWPWPGGKAVLQSQSGKQTELIIARASLVESPEGGVPGTLNDTLHVLTGQGWLEILEVKPAGKRLMDWASFVNGHRPMPGDSFKQIGTDHE